MPFLELDSNGNPIAEYGGRQPNNPDVWQLSDDSPEAVAWQALKDRQDLITEMKEALLGKYNQVLNLLMGSGEYTIAATYSNLKTFILDLLSSNNLIGVRGVIASIPVVPNVPELSAIKSEMLALLDSVI